MDGKRKSNVNIKYFVYLSLLGYMLLEPLKAYITAVENIGAASTILGYIKILKYLFVAIGVVTTGLNFLYLNSTKHKKLSNHIFYSEFKQLFIVIFAFSVISIYYIIKSHNYTSKTIEETLQLIIPAVIVFMVMNYLSLKEIYHLFSIGLIYSFFFYVLAAGPSVLNFFNIFKLNLFNSTSAAYEIHEFAVFANAYIAFFIYYRKKNWVLFIIAFLFNLLTFKRVYVLFSFLLLGIVVLKKERKVIKSWIITICKIATVMATVVFNYFLEPSHWLVFEKIFNIPIENFTMNRAQRVLYYLQNYHSYGFGSVSDKMLRGYFELDLVKILLETSIIGLSIFVICYWNISGRNLFTFLIMACQITNMLFSWSLSRPYKWAVILITIGCILYKNDIQGKWYLTKSKIRRNRMRTGESPYIILDNKLN